MCDITTPVAGCEEEKESRLSLALCSHVNWFMTWSKSCKSFDKLELAAGTATPLGIVGAGPPLLIEVAGDTDTTGSWLLVDCPVITVLVVVVRAEDEDEAVDSPLFVSLTLVGGEGVIGGSSPSSRGLIGGVLSSPWINLPGDSARSSSGSSGLLIDRALRGRGLRVLGDCSTFLLFGSGVLILLELLLPPPPGSDMDPGGVLLFNALLPLPLTLAIATGCGGDLRQVGVFSALFGSVLMATVAKLLSTMLWCPLAFEYLPSSPRLGLPSSE